jgi:BCD family chlorophyll transporter-like MFS transporter
MISLSLRSLDGISDPALLEPTLLRFMVRVAAVIMLLTLLATWGMETPVGQGTTGDRSSTTPSGREDTVTLAQSWELITSSRQVLIFFTFVLLFTLGLFLQDPVLESYGAQVFAMPIAATAQLNAFWGIGTLCGLLVAGLWVVPNLGKLPTARLGCRLIAASLLLLILAGFTTSVSVLQVVMLLFGLAAGIGTNSVLCLMLDLTLPEAAGTFVGVWGLAQALSRAIGKVVGGALYDLGRLLPFGDYPLTPFVIVFGIELAFALLSLSLLNRLNVGQFREDTGRSLRRVLEMELG